MCAQCTRVRSCGDQVFILYLLVTAADDFDASRDVQVIGSRFSDCSLLGNLGDRR